MLYCFPDKRSLTDDEDLPPGDATATGVDDVSHMTSLFGDQSASTCKKHNDIFKINIVALFAD